MGTLQDYFEVARCDDSIYIRVVGLANFNNSHLFQEFVDSMMELDTKHFYVDLAGCLGMDSTFMGVLIGIQLHRKGDSSAPSGKRVYVINATERCLRQLKELGLSRLIKISKRDVAIPSITFDRLQEEEYDPKERILLIRKAHENLTRIDEKNRETFQPFLESLAADLRNRPADS